MSRTLLPCLIAALALAGVWTGSASAQGNCPGGNCGNGGGSYYGAYGAQWSGPRLPHTGGLYGNGINCLQPRVAPTDLFYNYYAPANCGAIPAAMYISPRPVPELVGHTYNTYPPLLPQEFMYTHHRSYHSYYDGGRGLARTCVEYHVPPVKTALWAIHQHLEIPR